MKPATKKMIGKTYSWKGVKHQIKNIISLSGDMCRVITPQKEFECSENQLIEDFIPVASEEEKQTQLTLVTNANREIESMNSLSEILMDNIKKVQDDPGYIDRAKSINESAKNLIELKKTQLEVVKLLKS